MSLASIAAARQRVTRHGNLHWTLCPFHGDRHPSLAIYPDDHYHCFACEAHGSVIDWLMKVEKLTYAEAKKKLGTDWVPRRSHAAMSHGRGTQPTQEPLMPWPARGVQYEEVALLRERLAQSRWSDNWTRFILEVSAPSLTDDELKLRHPYATPLTLSRLREIYPKASENLQEDDDLELDF